jgi:hypothetical protein
MTDLSPFRSNAVNLEEGYGLLGIRSRREVLLSEEGL